MKNVLITGGLGNLGSWITEHFALQTDKYKVYVLTKNNREIHTEAQYETIHCNIADLEDCQKVLGDFEFHTIVHTASVNDGFKPNYPYDALQINALGTRNLLEVFKDKDIQNFIYFSTFQVYGQYSGTISEETETTPKHDYGTSHLFAEYYVKQFHITHKIPYTIVRLTNSYGCPKDYDSSKWYLILNDLSRTAFEKKEIVLKSNGQAPRDFIWMGTVARIVEALSEKEASNDTYNISGQNTRTMVDVANDVQKAYLEYFGEEIPIQLNTEDKTVHPTDLYVESEKLRNFISIEDTVEFQNEAKNIFAFLEKK